MLAENESLKSTAATPVLFTGDTLFIGSCGKWFDNKGLALLTLSLERLSTLAPSTVVFPGKFVCVRVCVCVCVRMGYPTRLLLRIDWIDLGVSWFDVDDTAVEYGVVQ